MAQPIVADYVTFSDTSFDLSLEGDSSRKLEEVLFEPESGQGPIIMFTRRREASGPVSYEVRLNGTLISDTQVNETDWHTVHEHARTVDIEHGVNEIEFRVTGGTGFLSVGDVTLFYRRRPTL